MMGKYVPVRHCKEETANSKEPPAAADTQIRRSVELNLTNHPMCCLVTTSDSTSVDWCC